MREQFEKAFPDKSIFEYVDYDHECGMYGSKEHVSRQELIGLFAAIANLNGAWWAWQEQQKKVEALIQSWNEKGMRGCSDYAMGAMHSLQNCTDELGKTMMGKGQHFDDVEFQVDWSQAHEDANWWAMDAYRNASWFINKPSIVAGFWGVSDNSSVYLAPNFNYTGAWQDSLRKRPKDNNHG